MLRNASSSGKKVASPYKTAGALRLPEPRDPIRPTWRCGHEPVNDPQDAFRGNTGEQPGNTVGRTFWLGVDPAFPERGPSRERGRSSSACLPPLLCYAAMGRFPDPDSVVDLAGYAGQFLGDAE